MVLDHYFMSFLPFLWPINYNHAYWGTKFFTHSSLNWFWSIFFSFPWIHGITHDYILWASSHTNERRIASKVILRFDVDLTLSWWRSWTAKGAPSCWNWTLSSLVLSKFSKHFYFGDFVAGWPCFCWWTRNYLRRFLWNWRHLNFCMVFNSQHWTLPLVAPFDSSIAS